MRAPGQLGQRVTDHEGRRELPGREPLPRRTAPGCLHLHAEHGSGLEARHLVDGLPVGRRRSSRKSIGRRKQRPRRRLSLHTATVHHATCPGPAQTSLPPCRGGLLASSPAPPPGRRREPCPHLVPWPHRCRRPPRHIQAPPCLLLLRLLAAPPPPPAPLPAAAPTDTTAEARPGLPVPSSAAVAAGARRSKIGRAAAPAPPALGSGHRQRPP